MCMSAVQISFGQDLIIDNLNNMPNFVNPSFYGFKNSTKIGIMNRFPGKLFTNSLEYRYAFANTYVEGQNFSLGADFYSSSMGNSGYTSTQANLSYIYELEFYNDWYLYAGITAGFSSSSYKFDKLVFQDQIDLLANTIYLSTIDPLAGNSDVKYFDIGASFMAHNNKNLLVGLSMKHLNRPGNTVDEDQKFTLDILFSAQLGYEFNLNKYGQSMLPANSYLYLFNVLSKQATKYRMDFYQELSLNSFGIGISEHINYMDDVNMHEIGVNATFHVEFFDFGVSLRMPISTVGEYIVNKSLSAFLIFDLDPLRSRRRGDYSKFY